MSIDFEGLFSIDVGHLKIVLLGEFLIKKANDVEQDGQTKNIYDTFIACLNKDKKILYKHAQGRDRQFILKIIQIELGKVCYYFCN